MAIPNRVDSVKNRLAIAMAESKKKQIDIAEETGLNRSIISRCVSGKVEPGNKTIMLLAKSLNVSEMWLWGYDVPKQRLETEKPTVGEDDGLSERERQLIQLVRRLSDKQVDGLLDLLRSQQPQEK